MRLYIRKNEDFKLFLLKLTYPKNLILYELFDKSLEYLYPNCFGWRRKNIVLLYGGWHRKYGSPCEGWHRAPCEGWRPYFLPPERVFSDIQSHSEVFQIVLTKLTTKSRNVPFGTTSAPSTPLQDSGTGAILLGVGKQPFASKSRAPIFRNVFLLLPPSI